MPCTVQSGHTQTTISEYEINSYKTTRYDISLLWNGSSQGTLIIDGRLGDEAERLVAIT